MQEKKKVKLNKIYLCMFFACLLVFCMLTPCFIPKDYNANADTITYTDVISDLSKDDSFDMSNYPQNDSDYSLSVIQIAESVNNELFVYVYQPCSTNKDLYATSISISITMEDELNYKNYTLKLLNNNDTIFKYIVNNFVVSDGGTRYYNISAIYRKWNDKYDVGLDNDNIITETAFPVEKQFTATTMNDCSVIYICNSIDTVIVTSKYVGFVRYDGGYTGSPGLGFSVYENGFDSHFVAFSTDRNIDRLMEADVYYDTQHYHYYKATNLGITISETEQLDNVDKDNYSYITYVDSTELYIPQGLRYGHKFTFNRIQSVQEFLDTENREYVYSCLGVDVKTEYKITDEGLSDISDKQWVLRFCETEYVNSVTTSGGTMKSHTIDRTQVSDVSILRLKFETDSVVYNLGVVDNKQTGDGVPDNDKQVTVDTSSWLQFILDNLFYFLLIILIVILIVPFLPFIIRGVLFILKYLCIGIWYLIKYLCIGIYWLFAWPFYLKKR